MVVLAVMELLGELVHHIQVRVLMDRKVLVLREELVVVRI
jgi:hypothetical protein